MPTPTTAITLRQPWASLVASGHKTIENRSWLPPARMIGQRIAIHAGAGLDRDGLVLARQLGIELPDTLPRMQVIATATIVQVVDSIDRVSASARPWWRGPLAWVLADIERVDGPACPGRLGLWPVPHAA